jgi:hypothetical protein
MSEGTAQTIDTIKAGQNFPDLAQTHYGDWTRYQRIVDANPQYAGRQPHTDNRWTPPVIAPLLYVGDKVTVPIDPQSRVETAVVSAQPKAGKVIAKSNGSAWLKVKHQAPTPKIEIYEPDKNNPYLTFEAEQKGDGHSQKLLNYSFSGGVDDLYGAFSFAIEGDVMIGGVVKTALDAIPKRSVIKIYEADEIIPAFVGIVTRRRI